MNQLFGYDPKYEGFDFKFPSPPRIHWLGLLLGWFLIQWIVVRTVPLAWQGIALSLVFDGWAFYLCNWLRMLDTDSKSPFWCDVYVVVQLGCAGLGALHHTSQAIAIVDGVLELGSVILGIATVFLIKHDLETHYNDREHAGLVLNGLMTFFFSFIYFQFHLYDIAQRRKRVVEAMGVDSYGPQVS